MTAAANDVVVAWCERDHARALLPVDHEIIDSTAAARALVIECLRRAVPDRDLFHACAVLGRLVAERGGSPTLASSMMDGAAEALGGDATPWLVAAGAALAEGFAAARVDMARREASAAWDYPRCSVRIDDETIAIIAGYPDHDGDDGEALAAWAARVAHGVALAGVRRAIVAGGDAARVALADALTLVGVKIDPSAPLPSSSAARPWRLWKR